MSQTGELYVHRTPDGATNIRIAGSWRMREALPDPEAVEADLVLSPQPHSVTFDTSDLTTWDSGILTFVTRVVELGSDRGIQVDRSGLPMGVQRLLALSEAVPEKEDARAVEAEESFLEKIGAGTISFGLSVNEMLAFIGDASTVLLKLFGRKVRFRRSDLMMLIQQVGAEAVGIVTLICFLVGLILAFVGAAQLQQFGATIYVANLVGVAMVRDVGALMAGIVMAGRSGAAFAAELASMKVSQEIDALSTMGIDPLEFLVLPRIIALAVMMPLLCLYADFVGILGGAFIGITMLDLSFQTYMQQTADAVNLVDLVGGMLKAFVYGLLIAIAGTLRGMQASASSAGVGAATTSAVVTSIVFIIGAAGIFSVVFYILGI